MTWWMFGFLMLVGLVGAGVCKAYEAIRRIQCEDSWIRDTDEAIAIGNARPRFELVTAPERDR